MALRQTGFFVAIMAVVTVSGGALLYHRDQTIATARLDRIEAFGGKELFADLCETCHGPGGDGAGGAPVLNDGTVLQTYPTPPTLSHFIQTHMPASDPGILTVQETTDLALYIFQLNHRLPPVRR